MTLLIPLSYLNEACYLSQNVDEKKFKMVLNLAQDDLAEILGAEFNEQIVTQYGPPDTLTADNAALYEGYIKDYLAWQTYYNYLAFAQVDSTPTGIRVFREENSDIVADVGLYSLEKNVMQRANKYKDKMINFLVLAQRKDSTKYPLYFAKCNNKFSFAITGISKDTSISNIISITKDVRANE